VKYVVWIKHYAVTKFKSGIERV